MGKKKKKVFTAKKLIKPLVILLIILILALVLFRLSLQLNFLLESDLTIALEPRELSIDTVTGEVHQVNFSLNTQSLPFCTAKCEIYFKDKSTGEIINVSEQEVSGNQLNLSYDVSVQRIGTGQDVYSVEATCSNERTTLCLTQSPKRFASSLVLVNYDLNEEEAVLKESLGQTILNALERLAEQDKKLRSLTLQIDQIKERVQVSSLLEQKAKVENTLSLRRVEIEIYRNLWQSQAYFQLNQQLSNTLDEDLIFLEEETEYIQQSFEKTVSDHNGAVDLLENISIQIPVLEQRKGIVQWYGEETALQRSEDLLSSYEKRVAEVEQLNFSNYQSLNQSLFLLSVQITNHLTATEEFEEQAVLEQRLRLEVEEEFDCLINQENNCSASFNSSLAVFVNETTLQCPVLIDNSSLSINLSNKVELWKTGKLSDYKQRLESIPGRVFQQVAEQFETTNTSTTFASEEQSNLQNPTLNQSIDFFGSVCPQPTNDSFALSFINVTRPLDVESTIDTSLEEAAPLCCLFGQCEACCTSQECKNDPATFPVIFLHGHAFNKASSAEYSLDAFNALQFELEQEGYLNAGIVTLATSQNTKVGEWGLSGRPVSVRASYYFDTFLEEGEYLVVPTKSESIDTYALRLRDIITVVKERTGRPQVDIIAHSMGGLVARKYMQIFGDDDVYKLIMIGTPNQGIDGSINEFCPLFGERKECLDMQEGSLFLNKLNDPNKQPENVQLHAIVGSGCETDGQEGDGIVSVDNALLEQAEVTQITGQCEGLFSQPLHAEMLDVEKYPQVFEAVKNILNS